MYSSRSDILRSPLLVDGAADPTRDLGQLRSGLANGNQIAAIDALDQGADGRVGPNPDTYEGV
jgi:hypothetical protein